MSHQAPPSITVTDVDELHPIFDPTPRDKPNSSGADTVNVNLQAHSAKENDTKDLEAKRKYREAEQKYQDAVDQKVIERKALSKLLDSVCETTTFTLGQAMDIEEFLEEKVPELWESVRRTMTSASVENDTDEEAVDEKVAHEQVVDGQNGNEQVVGEKVTDNESTQTRSPHDENIDNLQPPVAGPAVKPSEPSRPEPSPEYQPHSELAAEVGLLDAQLTVLKAAKPRLEKILEYSPYVEKMLGLYAQLEESQTTAANTQAQKTSGTSNHTAFKLVKEMYSFAADVFDAAKLPPRQYPLVPKPISMNSLRSWHMKQTDEIRNAINDREEQNELAAEVTADFISKTLQALHTQLTPWTSTALPPLDEQLGRDGLMLWMKRSRTVLLDALKTVTAEAKKGAGPDELP